MHCFDPLFNTTLLKLFGYFNKKLHKFGQVQFFSVKLYKFNKFLVECYEKYN